MTVQELIDELMKVEDKSKIVQVYSEGVYEDAENINEYDDSIVVFLIMEWKIGEIKQVNGEWYQCVKSPKFGECDGCAFDKTDCYKKTKNH